MSRSAESDAPIALSCSRRWPRSSAAVGAPPGKRSPCVLSRMLLMLLDAYRAHFLDVRDARQALLHAVLLERAHALLQGDREQLGDARVLLDALLDAVAGDEQLVQAAAPLEAAAAALVAAHRLVEGQMALVAAVVPHPVLVDPFHGARSEERRVGKECRSRWS